MYQICPHGKQDGEPCEQCSEQVKRSLPVRSKITDDEILSLWRTTRPSSEQDAAMTYESGPLTCPTWELRRLVELAIEYANVTNQTSSGAR